MTRVMVVTVGTSLFSSASWDPRTERWPDTEGLPERIEGYDRWWRKLRDRPDERLHEITTVEAFQSALTRENASEWAALLPEGLPGQTSGPTKRYSAELSTILALAAHQGETTGRSLSVREFLRSYDEVVVITDPAPSDGDEFRSYVAATHLVAYLSALAGDGSPIRLQPLAGLASRDPERLGPGLRKLQRFVDGLLLDDWCLELDLVLTGGYKLYGYLLSPLAFGRETVRMIYRHERAEDLVILRGSTVRVGQADPLSVTFQSLDR